MNTQNPDDLATGYKVKPEQRVTRQFNVRAMIGDCGDWRTLGELVGDAHAKWVLDVFFFSFCFSVVTF